MRTSIKNGIRLGAIVGVVILFFHLTGFSVVASSMLGSLLANVDKGATIEEIPALNLAVILALMGMIAGGSASKDNQNDKWSNSLFPAQLPVHSQDC